MPTPVMSLRVPSERQPLIRRIAKALNDRPELAGALDRDIAASAKPRSEPVGPFKDEESAIGFLRDRLIFALAPDQIWLFGSRARRDHRHDSDFDLLVVLPDGLSPESYGYERAFEAVAGSGIPSDIVSCSLSDFSNGTDVKGTLAYEVAQDGRLLYRKRRQGVRT